MLDPDDFQMLQNQDKEEAKLDKHLKQNNCINLLILLQNISMNLWKPKV